MIICLHISFRAITGVLFAGSNSLNTLAANTPRLFGSAADVLRVLTSTPAPRFSGSMAPLPGVNFHLSNDDKYARLG